MLYISCAPKIGPLAFDPLVYESQNYIKIDTKAVDSKEWFTPAVRTKESEEKIKELEEKTKISDEIKPFQGYDYDVTRCKYVNDRKICGYNKNKGDLKSDEVIEAGNGCQIRNGRVECGYLTGPFNIDLRHPQPNKTEASSREKVKLSGRRITMNTYTIENNGTTHTISTQAADENDIEIKVKKANKPTTIKENSVQLNKTNTVKPIQYCVEKMDRIFCYTVINK